jgi:tetratricopeptide (TPR) repeat protein
MAEIENRRKKFLIGIALSILVLSAYWGVTENDFIYYDDPGYVTENRFVQGGLSYRGVAWAFTSSEMANWHPLTWISLMADRQLYGMNPAGYHWTSVILHLMSTLVLFLALGRMTGQLWCSGLVAALFGVHPLHVESVAWVSERKDVLSGLFWMLGLWGYAWYAERPGWFRYGWVVLFFVMGLMSKPMVVTFPFVLLLLDWWPLRRVSFGDDRGRFVSVFRENGDESVRRFSGASVSWLILEKTPLLVLSVAASIITFLVQKEGNAVATLEYLPLIDRLANAIVSYAQYIVKMIFPFNLAVFYPHPGAWAKPAVMLSLGLISLISWFIFLNVRRRPYLVVGWFWYLGTLVPVIGLVQVGMQAMADRYAYLPLIGIFIMIVWMMRDSVGVSASRRMTMGFVSMVILAALVVITHIQVGYWNDSVTLFGQALRVTENNPQAHKSLGDALRANKKFAEAISHYREAIRISPKYIEAYNNLGAAEMEQGKFGEAMSYYVSALKIDPNDGRVRFNRGVLYFRQEMTDEAIAEYRIALISMPANPALRNNLGMALLRRGNTDEAIAQFRETIRLDPEHAGAHNNLAMLLIGKGQPNEAIAHFRQAILYQPGYAHAHYQLGLVLENLGRVDEALYHITEAKRINPEISTIY